MDNREPSSREPWTPNGLFIAALYLCGLTVMIAGLSLNSLPFQSFKSFVLSKNGALLLGSGIVASLSFMFLRQQYFLSRQGQSRLFFLYVGMSLVTFGVLGVTLECTMRVLAKTSPSGAFFLSTALLPKSWDQTRAHYKQLIDRTLTDPSFLVYDQLLGWTVGINKQSSNGLYFSTAEGLRSQRAGVQLSQDPSPVRIALVGDSFTFGEEVRFEETWGYHLAKDLGPNVQVLNFGVSGYGIDQSYLRIQKDVLSWKPTVVILGFIQADLWRSMTLYSFINFENWEFTFSKPRYLMSNGALTLINSTPLAPSDIFSQRSISDLPFVQYDIGFRAADWNSHPFDWSYLARAMRTYTAPPSLHPFATQNDLTTINSEILRAFLRAATESEFVPLIVYFPSRTDFLDPSTEPFGAEFIRRSGLPHVNLTGCISGVPLNERFVTGGVHYSASGNAAVAKCLGPLIHEAIQKGTLQRRAKSQERNPVRD
ncbi:MAG: SGNH/GDSL hydrolase family protein [Nitrospira sp.]|jgi:hypothetical protein